MPRKSTKKAIKPVRPQLGDGVEILNAGSVLEDPITRTLETNYMPYAMSVIVSRALPEIDGFKPAHRKLLYTMYEMGLLKGARTKSANIVGSTMHLNPHGDAAIYDTMVRMGRGNESLLVPFVDSKGNFGKAYSRDMSCAAARYTEAKLEGVCEELFRDIDKETVDFVPNYDSTTTEPTLLPVTFPTILANNTLGIAVGMACNICSFNLAELCATTVALMKDEKHDISTTMPAPDFVGGGQILYDEAQMREIYENGRGSVPIVTMLVGGVVKIVLNYNLVALPSVNIHGAPIGTLVCFALTALLNLIAVARIAPFRLNYPGYFLRPLFASLVMAFAARGVYALAAHFLIPSVEEAGRLTLLLCVGLAIGVAVVIYGVLVLALHCIRRSDLELLPKGDKLARLLHIS